jgi:hypothetical protein
VAFYGQFGGDASPMKADGRTSGEPLRRRPKWAGWPDIGGPQPGICETREECVAAPAGCLQPGQRTPSAGLYSLAERSEPVTSLRRGPATIHWP